MTLNNKQFESDLHADWRVTHSPGARLSMACIVWCMQQNTNAWLRNSVDYYPYTHFIIMNIFYIFVWNEIML